MRHKGLICCLDDKHCTGLGRAVHFVCLCDNIIGELLCSALHFPNENRGVCIIFKTKHIDQKVKEEIKQTRKGLSNSIRGAMIIKLLQLCIPEATVTLPNNGGMGFSEFTEAIS